MIHNNPLIAELETLSDKGIEEQIQNLQRKYFMSTNPSVQAQISHYLQIYKEELNYRNVIAKQKQKDDPNGNNDLDNLINVS